MKKRKKQGILGLNGVGKTAMFRLLSGMFYIFEAFYKVIRRIELCGTVYLK